MRKSNWLLVIILFLGCTQPAGAQSYWTSGPESTGSGVTIPSVLSTQQQNNMATLCRVWGFLKYFHPTLARGAFDADKGLFAIMPGVLNAADSAALNTILTGWVAALGEVRDTVTAPRPTQTFLDADMSWLEKGTQIGTALRKQLIHILENRHQGEGHYVSQTGRLENPNFSRELRYANVRGEDGGMRMLALFRFWNAIEYFFPSKYLTADNWNGVLKKFIPKFAGAITDSAYRFKLMQLAATIHDTHGAFMGYDTITKKYTGMYVLPVGVNNLDGEMVVWFHYSDSLRRTLPLEIGDRIIAINGRKIMAMVDSASQYVSASNPTALRVRTIQLLNRSRVIDNIVTIERAGKIMEFPVRFFTDIDYARLIRFSTSDYPMHRLWNDDIGYINLAKIQADSLAEMFRSFANTKGLIIDIRNYPKEFMPFALGKYLKPGPSSFAKFSSPDYTFPGRFLMGADEVNGEKNPDYYKGTIVILVNNESQSQAEYTAMALRSAPNAIVMGSQTMGADGNISSVRIPGGGYNAIFSGLGVYYPDGTTTQGIGIVPDVEVRPTIKGIREGKDEVLEKAMEYIRRKK